ncbi:MAG: YeeE/YedE thiosulfate transporter family protein [Tahibacter sp.]
MERRHRSADTPNTELFVELAILSFSFVAAMALAVLMGYAIQRGATCTVAALDQLVNERRAQRLLSIAEAAVWVSAGLFLARLLGFSMHLPSGYPAGATTVAGGALLGIGAFVNRACVFGAIARLGSGDLSYLATPVGFLFGCIFFTTLFGNLSTKSVAYTEFPQQTVAAITAVLSILLSVRIVALIHERVSRRGVAGLAEALRGLSREVWQPSAATCVIGISFVGMLLLVGAWAYTDVLVDLAHGMSANLLSRGALLIALFGGALLGGYCSVGFRGATISLRDVLRCLTGGALMGVGSSLIPGGNDGLLLVGMPLFWPYAWLALLAMSATITLCLVAQRQGLISRMSSPAKSAATALGGIRELQAAAAPRKNTTD